MSRILGIALAAVALSSCGGPQARTRPTPVPTSDAGAAADETGDLDSDGVVSPNDLCPAEAEDLDGLEDENGCPDPDNDNDRIPDIDDRCPNEPEIYNGSDDADGCPDQSAPTAHVGPEIRIMRPVVFARGSAGLADADKTYLDSLEKTLSGNPQIDRVLAAGHTSKDEGNAKAKIDLSRRRADAVIAHLVTAGVPAERLVAIGFADNCPLDERHTDQGRAKNRRVDFRVLAVDGEPTGAQIACPDAMKLVPESERVYVDAQKPVPPPPETLSQWEIRDALKSSLERLQACNGAGFRDPRGPAVQFELRIEIDPWGKARASVVKEGKGFNVDVAACVMELVESTHFPTAQRTTTIVYPFVIEPEATT